MTHSAETVEFRSRVNLGVMMRSKTLGTRFIAILGVQSRSRAGFGCDQALDLQMG